MKKIIISILCLMVALSSYAQRTPSAESSSSSRNAGSVNIENTVAPNPYHKFMFTYSPLSLRAMADSKDKNKEKGFHSIGLTYLHGSPLASFPLFIEYGGGLQYSFYRKDGGKFDMISVNVPMNLLYRFAFNGGKIHLAPYTGLVGKFNAWAKFSVEESAPEPGPEPEPELSSAASYDLTSDMRRFQLDWQIGAQFDVSKFYFQLAYLTDITSFTSPNSDARSYFGGINFGIGVVF